MGEDRSPTSSAAPDLTQPALFPLWTHDVLRYGDTDRQGHVNNAVFATFCETGRARFLLDPAAPLTDPGQAFVIARLILDYRAEVTWPGQVDIGTGVLRVGGSSMTLAQGVFQQGRCVATAESVIVLTDEATRRSTPLTPRLRQRLETLWLAGLAQQE